MPYEPFLLGVGVVFDLLKLKGSLLKGSFDKACAVTCRFLSTPPPTLPTPFSIFPYFPQGNRTPAAPLNPTPNPSPVKTTP